MTAITLSKAKAERPENGCTYGVMQISAASEHAVHVVTEAMEGHLREAHGLPAEGDR